MQYTIKKKYVLLVFHVKLVDSPILHRWVHLTKRRSRTIASPAEVITNRVPALTAEDIFSLSHCSMSVF